MYCNHCGSKINDSAKFCTSCGAANASIKKDNNQMTIPKYEATKPTYASQTSGKSNKSKAPIIALGIIMSLVVIGVVVFIWLLINQKNENTMLRGQMNNNKDAVDSVSQDHVSENDMANELDNVDAIEDPIEDSIVDGEPEESIIEEEPENPIHQYEILQGDLTWRQAYETCLRKGGHLVTIETDEEFEYVTNLIRQQNMINYTFWIGGLRVIGDDDSMVYYWERPGYEHQCVSGHWLAGEPSYESELDDGSFVTETCVDLLYRTQDDAFYFNDVPDDIISIASYLSGKLAYICEYEDY